MAGGMEGGGGSRSEGGLGGKVKEYRRASMGVMRTLYKVYTAVLEERMRE